MDLTSFLLSEQGELSLDAFTDSMLANLPQQAEGICSLDPVVPFQGQAGKAPDFGAPYQKLQQTPGFSLGQEPWDTLMLPEQSMTATQPLYTEQPMSMSMPLHNTPAGTAYMQQEPLPQSAAPAMPPMQQANEKSSSPRSSDGKEEVDYGKLQERIQKQKEKNARNQRQFRKRAKEKANRVEEQLQELTAKLAAMETEKHSLATRNKVLETALATAKATPGQTNPATSLASLVAAVADAQTVETLQPLVLHVREGQPLQLSVQQVQQMTWQELSRLWKEYVNGIAMALVTSGGPSDTPSPRLAALVEEMSALMKCVALHNAPLLHQHSCRRMDSGALNARDQLPPAGFYAKILDLLGLSGEQREQLLAHRHIKLVSLARLVQERRELQLKLQTVNDAAANPSGESAPIIGMGAEYPQLLEVTERLNENVAQLHRSVCLFMGQAWKKVLTPMQAGTFMVQAFPWAPDMLALANRVAEEAQAPPVKQIFDEVLRSPPLAAAPLLGV